MPKWDEITKNEKYQNLPPEARAQLKTEWFKANLLPEIESKPSLKEMGVEKVYEWFMQQPDDTGQGYVTSMLGAAGRGFGEMVPGAIEGVGALTGSEGLREFGQDVRGGLEDISPVNPIYGESIPVKLAGVGGQVGSMLATAGAGGLAGKALGGVGAATTGMRAAPLASAFLQGSAEGAREAEQYGMTGPEAYLRTLAGGAIEAGTEFLPFGMTAETALAKRILTGAPRTGTFLGAVGSEAGEEGLGQIASNIATKTLAPAGVETPDITAGALEAAAYGAAGGAMLGGVNALISTPPERQTQIQKDLQAEAGAIPKDTVPDQTNEEKMAAMKKGGVTVVSPDGKTAVIAPEPSMPDPAEVAKTIGDTSVEKLAATGNEASAAAQKGFNAILAEKLGETPEPTIQPEQEDEDAGAEVTPSPEMEMTEKSSQTITGSNGEIAPEMPVPVESTVTSLGEAPLSEGAERNRAVIAEALAGTPVQAAPIQPVETQENAIQGARGIPVVMGSPGYRITDKKKTEEYQKQGGWKLHLAVLPENYKAVDEWLAKNHKGTYKLLKGGDVGESDFTIYVGDKDLADDLAQTIESKIGSLLLNREAGTDQFFTNKVTGRFDVQRTGKAKDVPWVFYGAQGIPLDQEAAETVAGIKNLEDWLKAAQPELSRIDRELSQKYGTRYTGTKTKQQPATSPNTPKFSEEALTTSPVPETPPANITADTLPPIPEGMIRLTHGTSGQSIRDVLQSGRFNYSKQVVIDATTDSFGNNQDLAERLNTNMAGPMSREKFGDKVIIMDVPLDEYRKLRSFSADNPGFVPANRIVAVYDSNSKKLFAPELPQQSTSTTTQQTQEDAAPEIPLEESLRQEPQDRAESREAEETGAGDQLLRPAKGEVQGEVITPQGEPTTATEGMVTPGGVASPVPYKGKAKKEYESGVLNGEAQVQSVGISSDSLRTLEIEDMRKDAEASKRGAGELIRVYRHGKTQGRVNRLAPVFIEAVENYGITLPEGYVKQGDLYVFQPEAPASPLRISIPEGATSSRTDNVKYQVAGLPEEVVDPFLAHGTDSADAVEALVKSGPRKDTEHYEGRLVPKDDGSPWGNTKTSASFVIISKPGQTTSSPNEIGAVVVNRTSRGDEKTASMIAGMERRLDGTGVAVLTPEELPNWLRRTVSQTKAAEKQTPVPLREGTGAAGVVQSEPVEGSIPTVEKVSPETESESSEKLDTVAQIDRLVQSGAKPEEMDKFIKSLTDEQFNELVASEAFDVEPKLVIKPNDTYDAKRIKRRKFVDAVNASTKEVRKTAQQVFQEEEAAAKKQEKLEQDTKSSLNSVVGPQKKNDIQGTVTKADVEAARAALTNSGEIPNAYLTNVYESREAFLADRMNSRLFPASYVRLQTEKNIEGLFENGQTLVFAKEVQVSDLDRGLAKMLGVSDEQAAARRVIAHENGHRAISLFTMAEKRELRGYLMRAYSEEQIAKLVERYTEYADWRTNPESRLEALEELLMRDFERMEKIPTGGVWDDIVQFLKRVWRRLTGQKGEPTLKNLKDVVRLMRNAMKRPAVPLGSFRLKDGGEVKLSIRAYHGTPHKVDKFRSTRIGSGEGAQAYGWGLYFAEEKQVAEAYQQQLGGESGNLYTVELLPDADEFLDWDELVPKKVASKLSKLSIFKPFNKPGYVNSTLTAANIEAMTGKELYETIGFRMAAKFGAFNAHKSDVSRFLAERGIPGIKYLDAGSRGNSYGTRNYVIFDDNLVRILEENGQSLVPPEGSDIRFSRPQFSSDTSAALSAGSEAARSTLYSERDMDIREAIRRAYEAMPKTNSVAVPIGELFAKTEELMPGVTQEEFSLVLQDLFEDNGAVLQEGEVVEPLTEQDRRYLALAEDEDANREKLQRMVDEAAKDTGFNVGPVPHGTTAGPFNEFRVPAYFGSGASMYAQADSEIVSWKGPRTSVKSLQASQIEDGLDSVTGPQGFDFDELYAGKANGRFVSFGGDGIYRFDGVDEEGDFKYTLVENLTPVRDDSFNIVGVEEAPPPTEFPRIIQAYLRMDNPAKLGAREGSRLAKGPNGSWDQGLYDQLVAAGYDGVIADDDWGGPWNKHYIVFSPEQIKSADPVTRDDAGNVIPLSRRFDTGADIRGQINVTTPEGRRAGFVVVMPRAAKASRIKAEGPAVSKLQEDVRNIDEGSVKADFEGRQFTDTKPNQRTVKPKQSYTDAAVEFVDSLQNEGNSLEDIAYSIQSPEFIEGLGIERDLSMQDAIGLEVRNRINNALRKAKAPSVKARLNKLNLSLSKFWQGIGSVKGQHLAIRQKLIADPRYRWMFIKDKAEEAMKEARENVATANITSTDDLTNQMNREGEKADEQAAQVVADETKAAIEDDIDAQLLREGEDTLDPERRKIWDRIKDILRKLALVARAKSRRVANAAKASISKAESDAIFKMSDEELAKLEKELLGEFDKLSKAFLGLESEAKTPEQKKTRKKREKMVNTAKKRAEAGKSLETPQEGEVESSEEQVSKAEKTAQAILKDLSERYSDPLIIKEKKPNVDAMRELYKERVKQGVGPNQMTKKSFVNKAVELGADETTAGILWKAAELEIDAREAMRQDKILQRKAAVGARADAQAHRIIFAKERLKRQSGFAGIDTNPNKDTIIQAFRDQVKNPVSLEDFVARLKSLNVSETVAKRLFTAAEREKIDLEAVKKFQAETRVLEEIEIAENKASQIIYRFEEQYRQGFKNPPEGMTGKEQRDSIIRAFRDQVKNPTSFEKFAERLAKLKVGEEVAERMFLTASRERADLIRVKDIKIAKRKVEIASKQASRLIYETEKRLRQNSMDLETSKSGDSINKAFRDQISNPVSEKEFKQRLERLNVPSEVAGRLFKTAAREKADLEAMEAFRMLEGPDALKNILREIEGMRRGEEIPLRTPIPWRQLLSQKAKTVEEYRQRIFDAISSNEAFQNLSDDKKAKLADLFSEAWESKRKDILERMLTNLINKEEAAKRISQKGAQALREQSQRLVEDINLGILDSDELMKRLAEKFGIKSEFTEEEKQKIDSLIDTLQDSTLNRVKRNKAAYDLLKTLSGTVKVPITKLLADLWVTNVLSGINTMTSIALAVSSGAFELTSGVLRIIKAAIANQKQLPSEISASFKSLARFLGAFPREANLAWQYLVTGDRAFLDPSMNDVLNDLNYDSIGKSVSLAERLAESDKLLEKTVGVWMRTVSRLLTALDSFNSGVTKSGAIPIVARQLELDPATLAKVEESMNLQNYKDRIIQRDFAGVAPKTARERALVDSWAKDEMMADLDKYGEFTENADFFGQQGAMTLDPSGIGGMIYRLIKSVTGNLSAGSDRFLAESQRKWQERGKSDSMDATRLALAYALQFIAYNSANLAGLRFARFAGNKFNQGLSFIPGIGMLRLFEADLDKTHVKGKDAFMDMIQRNQFAGVMMSMVGLAILKAIADEPDDEKRGWAFNGGWANLTPERKQQKLAAGEKEYTIRVGDKVFNYQNWPISSVLAAIGGLSDLIRYSPEQWNEKSIAGRLGSAAASGVFAASEIPALSQFQELFGSNLSSKDPNEKKLDRFSRVMAGWGGGFVPRILKDFDFLAEPTLKKYDTLWERTASHIPVYRRYVGDDYYDILGKPIERKIYPGSREFMEKPSAPEYQVLGKLNSRGIWLTPANAEHRMVGKGRNRRRLTQEEADAYSLETGKGYRQMLLRYGQRALQMPTERARAFLSDKADEVRDRALKKVFRR